MVGSGSESQDDLRQAYGGLGYELRERNLQSVAVFNVTEVELAATAISVGNYRFDQNKSEKETKEGTRLLFTSRGK